MRKIIVHILGLIIFLSDAATAQTSNLYKSFQQPPDSMRPGVYWYWISDNISKEGVIKDINAMAEVGIGRAFIGNVGFDHLDNGLPLGPVKLFTEKWWDITRTAISTGTKKGVDIGLFNSPGWSQSGGPWVKPGKAMRYLSSEEKRVEGPVTFTMPASANPLFQPVAVIAFASPLGDDDIISTHTPKAVANIASLPVQKLFDGDLLTNVIFPVNDTAVVTIDITTPDLFTARSLSVYPAKQGAMWASMELQANIAGQFKTIKQFNYDRTNASLNVGFMPWSPVVVSFAELVAAKYRIIIRNIRGSSDAGLSDIQLSAAAKPGHYIEKQLGKMFPSPLPLWNEYQWPVQQAVTNKRTMVDPSAVIDLTKSIAADGSITWHVPAGKWIITRYGMLPTGVTNSPATAEGTGYDIDKLSKKVAEEHFDAYIGKIQKSIPLAERTSLKYVIADSYEMGSQNWSDDFMESFRKKYKYDPVPWLPVFSGRVTGSMEQADRFLWDVRRLVADKVAYDYVGGLRSISNRNGLKLWLENYGHWGFPSEFLMYGGQSDEVAGEFWGEGDLGSIECRDASSAAHIYGKTSVSAESFTSAGNDFGRYPALLKKRGDWSFTEGINNTIFHVYIHQPYEDKKPGVNAWFGTEFNRNNTWFKKGKAFIDYIRRCNFMLQQGKPVNDVAYFIGEDAPKMTGVRDPALPAGYQFDYMNAEVIEQRLSVKNGRLVLPDGMSYRMLVLPKIETMRPALLKKIMQLVKDGAVVVGPAPLRSPSMENYPAADNEVKQLAAALWKGIDANNKIVSFGKGIIMNGVSMEEALQYVQTPADFISNTQETVLYTHRTTADEEIYFISNQSDKLVSCVPSFRVTNRQPAWWDAVTGEKKMLPQFQQAGNYTNIPIELQAYQSCFIVFNKNKTVLKEKQNFPVMSTVQTLAAPWMVSFDTAMRGPVKPVLFTSLEDWSTRPEDSVKNYSGTAVYKTSFTMPAINKGEEMYIDLGTVKVMASVKLNGKSLGTVWTAPWRVNCTGAVKSGENKLEIEIVNTWVNRLIGDSKLPVKDRKTWYNRNVYNEKSKYDVSGLLGPVTIQAH